VPQWIILLRIAEDMDESVGDVFRLKRLHYDRPWIQKVPRHATRSRSKGAGESEKATARRQRTAKPKEICVMKSVGKMLLLAGLVASTLGSAWAAEKLGYLVKQPEEPWFQTEWAFADKTGKALGVEIIKIAVPDGEKTLNAIDTLAASGAKGFVICTPDPKLGPAIIAKAKSHGLKVIAVDDQFVNAKGQPMTEVPLVMMAATKIGERQGNELWAEMKKRGWKLSESGVLAITANELDTARRRTDGSMAALKKAGFPASQIYTVPTKSNDIPGALDAANSMLVQHPNVKHWLVIGMNDNTVLGGVRATEGQGFKAENVIGIGINGVDAVNELSKSKPTGFYGSLLPSPDVHGSKTVQMLQAWVVKGVAPAKFTEVTDAVLITRANFKVELKKKGL
jgi:L-arabinose transport system substrate-binding protein